MKTQCDDEAAAVTDDYVVAKDAVTELHVVIEPEWTPRFESDELREKWLNRWAQELMEFFRDHRSQDVNSVYVHKETEKQCSECDSAWEPTLYEEDGDEPAYLGCAWCGGRIDG